MEENPLRQLAFDYLETTHSIVFLTGKAGTGKTTFLREIRQQSKKKLAVVAPTGVAAINAGGMTIHSLFQLPFGPLVPSGSSGKEVFYSEEKKELLSHLELLIIDEVSMVRPDILDRVDQILRTLHGNTQPFGGVQLLLIGDLAQLSPIIREDEWPVLGRYYATPYFFSSLVLQNARYVRIELDHVFRQKEQAFVELLNEVRNQAISTESLELLNALHRPGFTPPPGEPYITLTTHNRIAQQLNNEFLVALPGNDREFKAVIRGEFPADGYPTETNLKLRTGAQVMFVKNDNSAEKLFYNGKIGVITRMEGDTVFVQCGPDTPEIASVALEWTNIQYRLNGQEIQETNAGSFTQLPLKLAWAITIHKSQGLTFDRAIIDVSEAFAPGQAYVALSRCRTLSGMVLRNPVTAGNIIGDPAVTAYNARATTLTASRERLLTDQELYRQFLLAALFDFRELKNFTPEFGDLLGGIAEEMIDIAGKFLRNLSRQDSERVQKAANWFREKLAKAVGILHASLPAILVRGSGLEKKAGLADQLVQWLMERIALMQRFCEREFTVSAYIAAKKKRADTANASPSYREAINAPANALLFKRLLAWRASTAQNEQVMPDRVATERTLAAIAEKLPQTTKALGAIKGMGQAKAAIYAAELIPMIRNYEREISGDSASQASLF